VIPSIPGITNRFVKLWFNVNTSHLLTDPQSAIYYLRPTNVFAAISVSEEKFQHEHFLEYPKWELTPAKLRLNVIPSFVGCSTICHLSAHAEQCFLRCFFYRKVHVTARATRSTYEMANNPWNFNSNSRSSHPFGVPQSDFCQHRLINVSNLILMGKWRLYVAQWR
jgi:hypothetical protein